MENSNFAVKNFFDTKLFPCKDLFTELEFVWDALPKISDFIKLLFENDVVRTNYKNQKHVFLGEGTQVQDGALIQGPLITGKNCVIGHASLIRENCILGDEVYIGHAVEIKNSIVMNRSRIAHLNYVGDSVIGNNVNISGGAMLANFRFDKQSIKIRSGENTIDTNLEKFGAVIGDDTIIGVNSVLNPGTILGKRSKVYPLVSVRGIHRQDEIIK